MKIIKIQKTTKAIKFEIKDGKNILGRGFLYLIYNNLHKKPYGLLEDVFVSEHARGQGLGTKIILKIIAEAKNRKCYKLIATSRHSNKGAHRLYAKLGLKKHGAEFRMDFLCSHGVSSRRAGNTADLSSEVPLGTKGEGSLKFNSSTIVELGLMVNKLG